ncbi:MAG: serine/threonine-protein kinase [Myxococcota bacterium]
MSVRDPFQPYVLGPWAVLSRLGRGGMAEVLLAEHSDPDVTPRLVVIKRLLTALRTDDRLRAMFDDEARLSVQLRHPNVVQVRELLSLPDGEIAMVLELMDGGDVGQLMEGAARRREALPLAVAVYLGSCMLKGLTYAHAARDPSGRALGIIHRDVTPGNILLTRRGEAKLGDFGVARANNQVRRTLTGEVKGKLSYMCPEMLSEKPFDQRADIFSAGVTLWELLTGKRLFNLKTEYEVMRAVLEAPIPSVRELNPEVPVELDRLVMRTLERDPAQRVQTARELEEQVSHVLDRFSVDFQAELALRVDRYVEGLRPETLTSLARPQRSATMLPTEPRTVSAKLSSLREREGQVEVGGMGSPPGPMAGLQLLARLGAGLIPRSTTLRAPGLPPLTLSDVARLWMLDPYVPLPPYRETGIAGELTEPDELLTSLRDMRSTGALHIKGLREALAFFREGALVYVQQPDVHRGVLHALLPDDEEMVTAALRMSLERGVPVWEAAVRTGVRTMAEVRNAMAEMNALRLEEITHWHGARYTFRSGTPPPYALP